MSHQHCNRNMNARRRLGQRRWGWGTYRRQAPVIVVWSLIAVAFGFTFAQGRPSWPAWADDVAALAVTFACLTVWKVWRTAAWRWRRMHTGPWVRQAPGIAGDAMVAVVLAYVLARVTWPVALRVGIGVACLAVVVVSRWRAARRYSSDRRARSEA